MAQPTISFPLPRYREMHSARNSTFRVRAWQGLQVLSYHTDAVSSLQVTTTLLDQLVQHKNENVGLACDAGDGRRPQGVMVVRASASSFPGKLSTFSSRINTDLPLYESPGATFADYLCDRPRVFRAMFPDQRRSERLNDEEWRIQMLTLEFLFLSVRPVVDMRLRCLTQGKDYPPGIPHTVPTVLYLQATRWELKELENLFQPTSFSLGVEGTLYSQNEGMQSRLKGQMEMSISCVLPPALSMVPQDIVKGVSESVLTRLVENMKQKVNQSLISDYGKFRREKRQKTSSHVQPPYPSSKITNQMKRA